MTGAPSARSPRPGLAAGGLEEPDDLVAGQGRGAAAAPAGHLLVGRQGVDHCLLGGLDHGLEERVEILPSDEVQLAQGRGVRAEGAGVGRGEGREQVTRAPPGRRCSTSQNRAV
jgi:hypothetical protein